MIELAIKEFNREEKLDKGYVVCDDWESSGSDWKNTLTVLKHFDDKFNNPERYFMTYSEELSQS